MRFYGVFSTFLFSIILFFKIIRTFLELSTSLNQIPSIRQIASETIGLRLKKIVAITTYAPADRFFRIELSRVFEATIYGFSIPKLLN